MKLRIEIDPDAPEEIVIRAKTADARLRSLQEAIERAGRAGGELAVRRGDEECYLAFTELLFFETTDKTVWAHTGRDCFSCPLTLTELERMLPVSFARASKSCIVNTAYIRSINRFPTGIAKATLKGSEKTVYISRMFYKGVREIIEETRLK